MKETKDILTCMCSFSKFTTFVNIWKGWVWNNLVEMVKRSGLRWVGHVLRREDNEPVKKSVGFGSGWVERKEDQRFHGDIRCRKKVVRLV